MRLSQAAFTATPVYASLVARDCLAGCLPGREWVVLLMTLTAALTAMVASSRPYAYLASQLLPRAVHDAVSTSGVLSSKFWAAGLGWGG